jgi:hypothetical protein
MDHQQLNSPPCTGPRIEVTVQSLHGITSNKLRDENGQTNAAVPHVTATIAFSGSASDMQVGSSTLCGTTGQLVIESKAAVIDPAAQQTNNLCGLTTEWRDERPSSSCRPHLTVALQECDPKAYKIPLPSINRDSRVVKEVKDQDHYDTDSTVSVSTIDSPRHLQSDSSTVSISTIDSPRQPPSRGSSTFWSNAGAAALPEIVELFVTLKTDDANSTDGQVCQGIAHLVVFGHEDDLGTFSMELPVKKASHSELSTSNEQPDIFLTTEARLRIEVKVFPSEDNNDHKIASSSSESNEDIVYTRSLLDEQMKKLQEKVKRNEDLTLEHVQTQKNAIDLNLPMEDDYDEEYTDGRSVFCNGLWSWDRLWQTFSAGVRHCDEGTAAVIAISGDSSDCSTIATRYSLDI